MNKDNVTRLFSRMPALETPRLVLRRMRVSDAEDMFAYARLEEVTRFLLWNPHENIQQTRDYLHYIQKLYRDGDYFDWGVELKETGRMVGTCGFTSLDYQNNSAEIGYVLNPSVWGRGLAPEAVSRVLRFAFLELNVHRVEARYMVGNDRSRRVMEKCGMKFEGIRRASMFVKGDYRDIGGCAVLSDEFMPLISEHAAPDEVFPADSASTERRMSGGIFRRGSRRHT